MISLLIGYLGIVLLMLAFLILNTKYSHLFVLIDLLATILLLIHSIFIEDFVFIIMNGFIALMLTLKLLKKDLKV